MNLFKTLIFLVISIVLIGCEPSRVIVIAPPKPEPCEVAYEILKKCYQVGIGETVNSCAVVTVGMINELRKIFPDDPKFVARLSLACGQSCAAGTVNTGFFSYSEFKDKVCN